MKLSTEIQNYCKNSANPVGRTILELNGIRNEEAFKYSDDICTALQLTNFYQDINIDLNKNRLYLPLDELEKFGVKNKDLELRIYNNNFKHLLKFQTERAAELFKTGRHLIGYLQGRLRYQILWTILGGEMILKKIQKLNYNTLNFRPTLSKIDYINLMIKSFMMRK
jgi:phytoene/squalene synthetase